MVPKAMGSLDLVEAMTAIEEIFDAYIPDNDTVNLGSPKEVVAWLDPHLSNRRPNRVALTLLRKLAKAHSDPELAEGTDGPWRREQIAAVVREIFHQ